MKIVTTASFLYRSNRGCFIPPIDSALTGQSYSEPIRVPPDYGCGKLSLPDSTRLRLVTAADHSTRAKEIV